MSSQDQYTEAFKTGQQQYTDALKAGQEAWAGAVEHWTKTVQQSFEQASASAGTPGDPSQVIDQVFDFVEKLLEGQRELAKNLASVSSNATAAFKQTAESAVSAAKSQAGETFQS